MPARLPTMSERLDASLPIVYPAEPQLENLSADNWLPSPARVILQNSRPEISAIAGNVPDYVKQLTLDTYRRYAARDQCFAATIGQSVTFLDISARRNDTHRGGRTEVTTIAEIMVTESKFVVTAKI